MLVRVLQCLPGALLSAALWLILLIQTYCHCMAESTRLCDVHSHVAFILSDHMILNPSYVHFNLSFGKSFDY